MRWKLIWSSAALALVLTLVASSLALGYTNVAYCGQLGDGTPHCASGGGYHGDAGFSNNDTAVIRAFTGQYSTNYCTTGSGYACPKSTLLQDTNGQWACFASDYNTTTSCGYTPYVYSRAFCESDVVANPDPFAPWANCWKRRYN